METVGQLITARAARRLLGRDRELSLLAETLGEAGPLVVFVHGLGGIGKTTLLKAHAEVARDKGATIAAVDCGAVEPTERGLVTELARVLGSKPRLSAVLDRIAAFDAVLLVLDAYERFRLLDTWVRQDLVPALPESARIIIGSREPPAPGWDAAAGADAPVCRIELGPLPEEPAVALLCQSGGLDEEAARRLNRVVRGHPLALRVAQAAAADRPDLDVEALAVPRMVETLTRLYLDDLDVTSRRVVDAAATVRRATVSLLGALLPDLAPQDAFDRLRALPFVHMACDGLHLHDSVQETAAEALRAIDPTRYRAHRRAAWQQLRREVATAARGDLWRYTADLLYLIEQPIVREAFFPSSGAQVTVETAHADDGPAIREITERYDRPGRAEALHVWWERLPETFSVARDRSGKVLGYDVLFEHRRVRRTWLEQDPLTSRWLAHLREDPVPRDQLVLFNPRWLDADTGEAPSDSQAAFFMETKRVYMELRPRLRRLYLALIDVSPYAVVAPRLGFRPVPDPQVEVGGIIYHSFVLDFGPGSVDAWLSWLIGSELGGEGDQLTLDPTQLQAVVDGTPIQMSRLEFGVLSTLVGRQGRAVSRADLIEQVWGTSFMGGSNVVDAIVRTLRRKLADRADLVETVRGVGYRYTGS